MLTDEQIIEVAGTQCAVPGSYAHALARAIEAAACAPLLDRIAELEALSERLKIEAQCHAQEASTANATIAEIYQLCSGRTGEPGNWHGADPVRQKLAELEAKLAQRVPDVDALADKIASLLGGTYHCLRVWNAWNVGTMSQDDFEPVDESETPREIAEEIHTMLSAAPAAPEQQEPSPIDMVLHCPGCGTQHIDAPEPAVRTALDPNGVLGWPNPPHRSHLCHDCGYIWRPADVPTNGVAAVKTKGKADSPVAQAPNAQQATPSCASKTVDSETQAALSARGSQQEAAQQAEAQPQESAERLT